MPLVCLSSSGRHMFLIAKLSFKKLFIKSLSISLLDHEIEDFFFHVLSLTHLSALKRWLLFRCFFHNRHIFWLYEEINLLIFLFTSPVYCVHSLIYHRLFIICLGAEWSNCYWVGFLTGGFDENLWFIGSNSVRCRIFAHVHVLQWTAS